MSWRCLILDKPSLVMMVGLPGSGKSTEASRLASEMNGVVLSSDALRGELFGDESHQENPGRVFDELYRRARKHLADGTTVLVDATNIAAKKRISALQQFRNVHKVCIYMDTPPFICRSRDSDRGLRGSRHVGFTAIDRMHKQLQTPTYFEGWDEIRFVHHIPWREHNEELRNRYYYEAVIASNTPASYENLFLFSANDGELMRLPGADFMAIRELPQDNPHHTFSVSRHTYDVYRQVHASEQSRQDNWLLWLWTALFHDLGKGFTKEFGDRYAHFYGHENVSAQLAISTLHRLGYSDEFALEVATFVQWHMRLLQIREEAGIAKLQESVGPKWAERLRAFREFDEAAR